MLTSIACLNSLRHTRMADRIASQGDHPDHQEKVVSNDLPLHESETPHNMSVREYVATRFSTLKPPMHKAPNPFKLLAMLNTKQWMFFFVAFFAWVSQLNRTRRWSFAKLF